MVLKIKDSNISKVVKLLTKGSIAFEVLNEVDNGFSFSNEFMEFIKDYPYKIKMKSMFVYYVMKDIYDNYGAEYKTIKGYSKFYVEKTGFTRQTLQPIFEVLQHGGFLTIGYISVEGKNWSYSTAVFNPKGK